MARLPLIKGRAEAGSFKKERDKASDNPADDGGGAEMAKGGSALGTAQDPKVQKATSAVRALEKQLELKSGALSAAYVELPEANVSREQGVQLAGLLETLRLPWVRLDVSVNPRLGDPFAIRLGGALFTNQSLTELNLTRCEIQITGAKAFAAALRENRTLTSLDMHHNFIGVEGAKALADAIVTNSTLIHLDISRNNIDLEGALAWAKCIERTTTLQHFLFSRNFIGPEGVTTLVAALRKNFSLVEFDLEFCASSLIHKNGKVQRDRAAEATAHKVWRDCSVEIQQCLLSNAQILKAAGGANPRRPEHVTKRDGQPGAGPTKDAAPGTAKAVSRPGSFVAYLDSDSAGLGAAVGSSEGASESEPDAVPEFGGENGPARALCYFVRTGRLRLANGLLHKGVSPDVRLDSDSAPPLFLAIESESESESAAEMVALLVRYGADPNGEHLCSTALHAGAARQDPEPLKALLSAQRKVQVNCLDGAGDTPLHVAARKNLVKHVALLVGHVRDGGSNRLEPEQGGETTGRMAAGLSRSAGSAGRAGEGDQLAALLHVENKEGQSALLAACVCNATEACIALLEAGADPNVHDANGDTPLHWSVRHSNEPMGRALLGRAAAFDAKNNKGQLAVDLTDSERLRYGLKQAAGVRDVMISYGHMPPEVAAFARRLRDSIQGAKITCWMDEMNAAGITAGSEWRGEIADGIRDAVAVIFVASSHSVQSEWCKKELALAKRLSKHIFPVWREKVDLDAVTESYLFSRQFVDFTSDSAFDSAFAALLSSLRDVIFTSKRPGATTSRSKPLEAPSTPTNGVTAPSSHSSSEVRRSIDATGASQSRTSILVAHAGKHPHVASRICAKISSMRRDVTCTALHRSNADSDESSAVVECATLVVVLSRVTVGEPIIRDQIALAENRKIPVVTLTYVDDWDVPPPLAYSLANTPMLSLVNNLCFDASLNFANELLTR